jgi:hypothetical protein
VSDFGVLGGMPTNPKLLDWLGAEFVSRKFSMKEIHKLILTSDAYKQASAVDAATVTLNSKIDPANDYLWSFRLQRLEAEPIWDSILASAGTLDLTLGGPSFDISAPAAPRGDAVDRSLAATRFRIHRGAYMIRAFQPAHVVPNSRSLSMGRWPLALPDADAVTAPQALFLMNGGEVDGLRKLAERLQRTRGHLSAVDLGHA